MKYPFNLQYVNELESNHYLILRLMLVFPLVFYDKYHFTSAIDDG